MSGSPPVRSHEFMTINRSAKGTWEHGEIYRLRAYVTPEDISVHYIIRKYFFHFQISAIESKRQIMSITYKPWTILNSFTPFEKKRTSDNKTTKKTRQIVQVTLIKPSVSPDNSQVYSQQKLSDHRRSSRAFCCSMYLVTDANIHSFNNTCIIQRWECSSHVWKTMLLYSDSEEWFEKSRTT